MGPPFLLCYSLSYGERLAGKGKLCLEAGVGGLRAEFKVQYQQGVARWVSEMGPEGDTRRFTEFAGTEASPVFGFKVLPDQAQIRLDSGSRNSFPWVSPVYDPLSLLINLPRSVTSTRRFEMVGGHAFAQKLAEESLPVLERPTSCSVYRVSPGTVLAYFHPSGYPVQILEQRGAHVLTASLVSVERELAPSGRRRKRPKERR